MRRATRYSGRQSVRGTAGADESGVGLRIRFATASIGTRSALYRDVDKQFEEIDIGQSGGNFGWNLFEGKAPFCPGAPTGGSVVAPIYAYGRSVGVTVIGGCLPWPERRLQGDYFSPMRQRPRFHAAQ